MTRDYIAIVETHHIPRQTHVADIYAARDLITLTAMIRSRGLGIYESVRYERAREESV